jgi:colanic acid/amylovoran biosynthesis glycosyltransferase
VTQQTDAASVNRVYILSRYPKLSETFVRNEIQGLRARGASIDVISLEAGDTANIDATWAGEFRHLPRPRMRRAMLDHLWCGLRHPVSYARYLRTLLRLRECWRFAVLRLPTEARRLRAARTPQGCHTHFAWATASIASYLARLLDVPASVTVHANDIYVGDERRLRVRLSHFDRVVTVCNYNVGLLSGKGIARVGDGAIDIVPCGVAVPGALSDATTDRTVDVVSVGRLVEKKGFDTFIRAMALVRDRRPEAKALIVGEGPERAALEALISELGLAGTVTMLGAKSHEQTLQLVERAKVFCLASRRAANGDCDAVPVAIREAMVRSVPVISTRVAGIPETVDDEVGWIVDPASPDQLACAISDALRDEHERLARGRAARARVLSRWTLDLQVAGMLDIFGRHATNRRPQAR